MNNMMNGLHLYSSFLVFRPHKEAAVAQEGERSPSNLPIGKVQVQLKGSIPGSSSPHVDVSLGKTLNPKLLQLLRQQCINVNEWLNSPPAS